jgi:hypothetical protein
MSNTRVDVHELRANGCHIAKSSAGLCYRFIMRSSSGFELLDAPREMKAQLVVDVAGGAWPPESEIPPPSWFAHRSLRAIGLRWAQYINC